MEPLTSISKVPDWIFLTIAAIYTFISPMLYQLSFLLLFVILDLISGIWVAKQKKEKISYKKLFKTFTKLFGYSLITLVGYIFDYIFICAVFGHKYMFSIFMMLIALNEFRSIINNMSKILGYDIWNKVIKSINKDLKIE